MEDRVLEFLVRKYEGRETNRSLVRCMVEFTNEELERREIAGYMFNGRFYKSIYDLRGKTMSEGQEPIPVYY